AVGHDDQRFVFAAAHTATLTARIATPGRQPGRPGDEVILFPNVGGAGYRGPELRQRSRPVTRLLEEVGSHRMEAVMVSQTRFEAIEERESGGRSLSHGGSNRPIEGHHRVVRHLLEE